MDKAEIINKEIIDVEAINKVKDYKRLISKYFTLDKSDFLSEIQKNGIEIT